MKEHIVCVDDEEGVLTALRQQLGARFGRECEIAVARSADDALELLDELERDHETVACVIADQIMPGMKGIELLEKIHQRQPRTIKILLTGQAGLDAVVYAINRAGLQRYIAKPWDPTDLRLTVETLLSKFRLEAENILLLESLTAKNSELATLNASLEGKVLERTHALEAANARLALLAVTDGLTGLYNHRYLQEQLAREVERSGRSGSPLSLLMIDVDHFKHFNDTQGHPAGDRVLATMARLISDGRRVNDVIARYGGEEFVVLLPDTTKAAAGAIAERLRGAIADHPFSSGDGHPVRRLTISVGVASLLEDASPTVSLLEAADTALYRAKHAGRNTVILA